MRSTHTNGEKGRSDRMLSPSTQVVGGLSLPRLEPIGIHRMVQAHDSWNFKALASEYPGNQFVTYS